MPTHEAWSEEDLNASREDSLGWETQTDDTWDSQQGEEEANDLTILDHSSFHPINKQHGSDGIGNIDAFELARKVITSFKERNIVFQDIELPTLEERSLPLT